MTTELARALTAIAKRVPVDLEWDAEDGAHERIPLGKIISEQSAEIERLRSVLADVKVFDTGHNVFIGVMATDGCASAKVEPDDSEMFMEWKNRRDAALGHQQTARGEK